MAGEEYASPLKQNILFDLLGAQGHTIPHSAVQNVGVTWFMEKVHILIPHRTNPTPTY